MVLINDLKPFKDEWRICVKLLHSWKSKTDYGGESFECIFVDKTGKKIHASCKRSLMFRVQRDTQKGEWREVENFKISAAGGQYRPSNFQYKMTIIGDTVIRPTNYRNDNHFLSLASYEDISKGECKPYFLIDVMGHIVDLGGVAVVQLQNGENRKRVQFRLRDTSGNELACCLWGTYAEQIETHVEESKDESIICLIRFAKIKEFRGEVQITNAFDGSVLMLNPTMEEAIDFKQKLLQEDLPLALLGQTDEKSLSLNNQLIIGMRLTLDVFLRYVLLLRLSPAKSSVLLKL
ncbi:replication protein A 70 kDa DNA-binding subunit A-like [Raphanus sativus]|uniref:Replication protein A 70 kDa DNA-binding subunit A-like n=1 Tax=Raphanus sativus TaxID=3726 RepID=A0A9W3BXE8_RAPSA|nr:replication protein A 70 kDa DNA-binding subunit A-like [Raphanus sativus]